VDGPNVSVCPVQMLNFKFETENRYPQAAGGKDFLIARRMHGIRVWNGFTFLFLVKDLLNNENAGKKSS
jgi:hypothetical protein